MSGGPQHAIIHGALADLDTRTAALDAALAELRGDRAAESADDEHDPDGAPLSGEWSRLTGLRDGLRRERTELESALRRLEGGTYGVCERCGRSIPEGRLEVVPTARRCVACAV